MTEQQSLELNEQLQAMEIARAILFESPRSLLVMKPACGEPGRAAEAVK